MSMFEEPEAMLPLWDYGWCEHRRIDCTPALPRTGIVESYLQSRYFGTSFVYPEPGENPELHGPFVRSSIRAEHFIPIDPSDVLHRVKQIGFESPGTEPISSEQWSDLEQLVRGLISRNELAFQLSLTVQNTDIQHEWGWVILDFHEFIFANKGSLQIDRLVIGFD